VPGPIAAIINAIASAVAKEIIAELRRPVTVHYEEVTDADEDLARLVADAYWMHPRGDEPYDPAYDYSAMYRTNQCASARRDTDGTEADLSCGKCDHDARGDRGEEG
jgi:hypothetical protein